MSDTPEEPIEAIILPIRFLLFAGPLDVDEDFPSVKDLPRAWENLLASGMQIEPLVEIGLRLNNRTLWWQIVDLSVMKVVGSSESLIPKTLH